MQSPLKLWRTSKGLDRPDNFYLKKLQTHVFYARLGSPWLLITVSNAKCVVVIENDCFL